MTVMTLQNSNNPLQGGDNTIATINLNSNNDEVQIRDFKLTCNHTLSYDFNIELRVSGNNVLLGTTLVSSGDFGFVSHVFTGALNLYVMARNIQGASNLEQQAIICSFNNEDIKLGNLTTGDIFSPNTDIQEPGLPEINIVSLANTNIYSNTKEAKILKFNIISEGDYSLTELAVECSTDELSQIEFYDDDSKIKQDSDLSSTVNFKNTWSKKQYIFNLNITNTSGTKTYYIRADISNNIESQILQCAIASADAKYLSGANLGVIVDNSVSRVNLINLSGNNLEVSFDSNNPQSSLYLKKGLRDFVVLWLRIHADSYSDLVITSVTFKKYGDLDNSFIDNVNLRGNLRQFIQSKNLTTTDTLYFSGINYKVKAGETHDLILEIDMANNIESNKDFYFYLTDIKVEDTNNNTVEVNAGLPMKGNIMKVAGAEKPDLIIEKIELKEIIIGVNLPSYQYVVYVKNQGKKEAVKSNLKVEILPMQPQAIDSGKSYTCLSGSTFPTPMNDLVSGDILPVGSSERAFDYFNPVESGNVTITAKADIHGAVDEENEGNNSLTKVFYIKAKVDKNVCPNACSNKVCEKELDYYNWYRIPSKYYDYSSDIENPLGAQAKFKSTCSKVCGDLGAEAAPKCEGWHNSPSYCRKTGTSAELMSSNTICTETDLNSIIGLDSCCCSGSHPDPYSNNSGGMPDLTIIKVEFSPAQPKSGEWITSKITVKNIGNKDIARKFSISYGGSTYNYDGLKTGAEKVYSERGFGLTIPGNNTVYYTVDAGHNIDESDEGNNKLKKVIKIYPSYTGDGTYGLGHWETVQLDNGLILHVKGENYKDRTPYKVYFDIYSKDYMLIETTPYLEEGNNFNNNGVSIEINKIDVFGTGGANFNAELRISSLYDDSLDTDIKIINAEGYRDMKTSALATWATDKRYFCQVAFSEKADLNTGSTVTGVIIKTPDVAKYGKYSYMAEMQNLLSSRDYYFKVECTNNGKYNASSIKKIIARDIIYISSIDGMDKYKYDKSEIIKLKVQAIESDGSTATQEEGYNIQYYTYNRRGDGNYLQYYISSNNYNASFRDEYWYIDYYAPLQAGDYYTQIGLYCSIENSKCWRSDDFADNTKTLYFSVSETESTNSSESAPDVVEIKVNQAKISEDSKIDVYISKARLLFKEKLDQVLTELKELRDLVREQQVEIKYLKNLTKGVRKLAKKVETALNNFITYGVDENTKKLGAGERAAVLHSFKAAFNKLPETEEELADAIKIANGRWPSLRNENVEKQAKEQFQKIYKRIADMNNASDNAAITVMAYGLRQKAGNRNLKSEEQGAKTFKHIYGYHPITTEDWNIMQAITYSGATRGIDTDGDLLTDEREVELGTDLNNPDTDGDGYLDGIEVANGYDPLGEGKM